MEHFVPLEKLPPGFEFPPAVRDRIHFDPDRSRLVYQGFMSKGEFDRLCSLSEDWSYRRPLEELFRRCTADDATPRSSFFGALTSLAGLLRH